MGVEMVQITEVQGPATAETVISEAPFLQKLQAWEIPSQQDYMGFLGSLGTLQAALALACGLLYLLQGWKAFKILVVVNAAIIGAVAGSLVGGWLRGENMPIFCGIAGSLLVAALAVPLMKYAVSLMGGLAGCIIGFGFWHHLANAVGAEGLANYAWAGALLGLVVVGMLAFIILRETIIVFTAVQGAFLAVSGLLAVLMRFGAARDNVLAAFNGNNHLLPLLILVPAVIGFAFQHAQGGKKGAGGSGAGSKKPATA